jgi:hypothetical protein
VVGKYWGNFMLFLRQFAPICTTRPIPHKPYENGETPLFAPFPRHFYCDSVGVTMGMGTILQSNIEGGAEVAVGKQVGGFLLKFS